MNKNTLILIIVVIALGVGIYFIWSDGSTVSQKPLPEGTLPTEELPQEYLEEVTEPEGTSADEKVQHILGELHTGNSGDYVIQNFPDLEYLFDWTADGQASRKIFPFFYYYSAEADKTFVICNINKTVAVCDGVQDSPIGSSDLGHCQVAEPYKDSFL